MKQREYDVHHNALRGQKERKELATLQRSPAINARSRASTGRAPVGERLARPRTFSELTDEPEELDFAPTINERSRVLERSVSQMYSWAQQRDVNREAEQARALQRSGGGELTGTPRLNDISCRIVANLGLDRGRVEDRLLRAHKERDEKVRGLQEAKANVPPPTSTTTTLRHHPGPRLHDEPRMRRSTTPVAAPTFRPSVNANATSHRHPATDVFSHLHQHGQSRRRNEEPIHVPDETFQPAINHTSRALATLRQTHYTDPVKAYARGAPDPALTFQPRIDPHSAALDRRLNENQNRVALLHAKCQGYVAHRARMGEQRSQEALMGCTFRPATTEYAITAGGDAMDVVARSTEWDQRRRSRLEKERLIRSDSDGAECTFRPNLTVF